MRRVVLIGGVLLCAACLNPRADPSAFFHLTPTASGTAAALPVTVGLGPVLLPAYLDRPQMVTRVGTNQVTLSETNRWAEPLGEGVARVLREDLEHTLSPRAVVDYPWHPSAGVDLAVAVTFSRFEADTTGVVHLGADWSITDANTGDVVARSRSSFQETVDGLGADARVAALSRVLARLGGEIGEGIRRAGAGGRTR